MGQGGTAMGARGDVGRWGVLAAASLGLLAAGSMLLFPLGPAQAQPSPFPMLRDWEELVRLHRLDPIAGLLPVLVAIDAFLASALALALALHPGAAPPVRILRRGLVGGALAAVYLFHLRGAWLLPQAAQVPADVAAFVLAARGSIDLCVFLVLYPRVPEPAQMLAYYRQQSRFRPMLGIGAVRARLNASLQALLSRWWPSLAVPIGSEAQVARSARSASRFLAWARDRRVHAAALAVSAAAGLLFGLTGADSGWSDFFVGMVPLVGVFVPMLGFSALQVNYRFGSDEDRRRISWIYFGSVAGFSLVSTVYWVLCLALVPALGGDGQRLFGLDLPALWVASMFVFVPVVVATFLAGLAVAIFQRGALDARLAIRRGAVIALCGVVLTVLFVVVEGAVTSQVVVRVGMPDETGAMIAGILAALVFAPVRNRVESLVARWVERLMPVRHLADGERRSFSVCFVDLCGYTALSEQDETTALLHAALLRKSAQAAAATHGGALVKSLGDGMMLRFDAPDPAMRALAELERAYAAGAAALRIVPLPMHAGLHHGEVVLARDGDLFGADVNLAARLCGAAGAQQVLLSATARAQLTVHEAQSGGPLVLKNVASPIEVFSATLSPARRAINAAHEPQAG